jgi:UDP-glucose 4-epimerase
MRLVVTGALGHIGSRLVRELPGLHPGVEIVMVDNLSTQRYASLFDLPAAGRYRFVETDVLEADLDPLVEGADAVVHLAAITDAAGSFERKAEVERVNLSATRRVADACRRAASPLVHLSSTSVYGTQREFVDEDCAADELRPQSPYAETKLREEDHLKEAAASGGLRFITCRFGTIAGVSPGMRFHTAVNRFCWQAVMGRPLTVWRTAFHQKRPYLALSDAVRAISFIIEANLFDGRVYNVLTDNLTVQQIVAFITDHAPDPAIEYVDTAIMNQLSYAVLSERFRRTGFEFTGSIRESVAETIRLLENASGAGGTRRTRAALGG